MYKKSLSIAGVAIALVLGITAYTAFAASDIYTFVARGIVKTGGTDLNVYFTHASERAESDLAGNSMDISLSTAKVYQWTTDAKGNLYKKRVKASSLTPGLEVVVRGVKKSNDTYVGSWVVINNRQFTINGTLKDVDVDAKYTDQGWIIVEVGNSTYKQSQIVNKLVLMRVNGTTKVTAAGKSKSFDEVSESNQTVRVKGQVLDMDHYALSELIEM